MTVPENWWSCDHPGEAIVLLVDKPTGNSFYACNRCGLIEGEHNLDEATVTSRLLDQADGP